MQIKMMDLVQEVLLHVYYNIFLAPPPPPPAPKAEPKRKGDFIWDDTYNLWYNTKTKWYFDEGNNRYTKDPSGSDWFVLQGGKLVAA